MLLHQAPPGFEAWFGHEPRSDAGAAERSCWGRDEGETRRCSPLTPTPSPSPSAELAGHSCRRLGSGRYPHEPCHSVPSPLGERDRVGGEAVTPANTVTMRILGLTGSIAMGKSTAAAMLRRMGVAVHDADRWCTTLTRPGGAAMPAITAAFPDLCAAAGINRRRTERSAPSTIQRLLRKLEEILHPMVRARNHALPASSSAPVARDLVVLDVPLLAGNRRRKTLPRRRRGQRARAWSSSSACWPAPACRLAQAARHRKAPDARCRETQARRFRDPHRPRPPRRPGWR